MKNLVCMISFKKPNQQEQPFVENTTFAWKKWCDKNNVDFLLWEDPLFDVNDVMPIVQRCYIFDLLEENKKEYDQICWVGHDTFPMWYCPNFFEMTNGNFTCALDTGEPHQLNRSIRMVRTNWFPEITDVCWANYFNADFLIFNKMHKPILSDLFEFYKKEVKETRNWYRINQSTDFGDDQTIINFLVRKYKYPITYLPRSFNVMDHFMRCIFFNGEDSNKRYISALQTIQDCVNMFHFTGDNNIRNHLTSYLIDNFGDKYN